MVAEKVRFEFACVLPGITSETPQKEGIFIAEPRLALMTGLFTENIKGQFLVYQSNLKLKNNL